MLANKFSNEIIKFKWPTLSEMTVLLCVVFSFILRHFVTENPLHFIPLSLPILAFSFVLPSLKPATLPLLVITIAEITLIIIKPIPYLGDWPFDMYLIAMACILYLVKFNKVDLTARWNFRLSRNEWTSAALITMLSVSALTIYYFNQPEVAKSFPLPELPLWSLPIVVVIAATVNALREELIYRFVLQRTFQSYMGTFWALNIQALAFGFLHYKNGFPQGWIGVILTYLFGLLIGSQFLWSRSMALIWITHALADASMFTIILAFK